MKKILLILSIVGFGIAGLAYANAQYYSGYGASQTGMQYYGDYGVTSASYSYPVDYSYSVSSTYGSSYGYGGGYGGGYGYGNGGIGSYTIGCTTYYYNTRTGAQLYTQNICYTYTQPVYTQPIYYDYPYYGGNYGGWYGGGSQYCTYKYINGSWYPTCGW